MNKTLIEWVKNPDGTQGYTWNPITGCLNGCPYCYARKLANTRLRTRYLANKNVAPLVDGWFHTFSDGYVDSRFDAPFYPRFWEDKIQKLVRLRRGGKIKPKGIFVCDMSDLFGIGIPEEWTRRVLSVIEKHPRHHFYLLTKQPQNLIKFSPFPDNCWVGVTATEQRYFIRALSELRFIEAKLKYLSLEPLLAHIPCLPEVLSLGGIGQVIIGTQTKPYKPPKVEYIVEILEACVKANIPVFLKDNLDSLLPEQDPLFRKNQYELRQEIPNV